LPESFSVYQLVIVSPLALAHRSIALRCVATFWALELTRQYAPIAVMPDDVSPTRPRATRGARHSMPQKMFVIGS
jgi:hypothetical protein